MHSQIMFLKKSITHYSEILMKENSGNTVNKYKSF